MTRFVTIIAVLAVSCSAFASLSTKSAEQYHFTKDEVKVGEVSLICNAIDGLAKRIEGTIGVYQYPDTINPKEKVEKIFGKLNFSSANENQIKTVLGDDMGIFLLLNIIESDYQVLKVGNDLLWEDQKYKSLLGGTQKLNCVYSYLRLDGSR